MFIDWFFFIVMTNKVDGFTPRINEHHRKFYIFSFCQFRLNDFEIVESMGEKPIRFWRLKKKTAHTQTTIPPNGLSCCEMLQIFMCQSSISHKSFKYSIGEYSMRSNFMAHRSIGFMHFWLKIMDFFFIVHLPLPLSLSLWYFLKLIIQQYSVFWITYLNLSYSVRVRFFFARSHQSLGCCFFSHSLSFEFNRNTVKKFPINKMFVLAISNAIFCWRRRDDGNTPIILAIWISFFFLTVKFIPLIGGCY